MTNDLLRGPLGEVFDSRQLITGVSGSGNNWAHGHHHYGPRYRDELLEKVRGLQKRLVYRRGKFGSAPEIQSAQIPSHCGVPVIRRHHTCAAGCSEAPLATLVMTHGLSVSLSRIHTNALFSAACGDLRGGGCATPDRSARQWRRRTRCRASSCCTRWAVGPARASARTSSGALPCAPLPPLLTARWRSYYYRGDAQ